LLVSEFKGPSMAVNYDCVASIRTVASIRPQSNSSAFRALSANFKLKEVYLSRNCSSHVFAKRDGQASLESIWEIGSKKLSIFRAALESEPDYPRLTVDLSISGQGEIKSNPRSFCILGRVEAGSKMCLHVAHAGCRFLLHSRANRRGGSK